MGGYGKSALVAMRKQATTPTISTCLTQTDTCKVHPDKGYFVLGSGRLGQNKAVPRDKDIPC